MSSSGSTSKPLCTFYRPLHLPDIIFLKIIIIIIGGLGRIVISALYFSAYESWFESGKVATIRTLLVDNIHPGRIGLIELVNT